MTRNESIIVGGIANDLHNGYTLREAIARASQFLAISRATMLAVLSKYQNNSALLEARDRT